MFKSALPITTVVTLTIFTSSCNLPGPSDAIQNAVTSVTLTQNGTLKLKGSVDPIDKITVKDGSSEIQFKILKKDSSTLEAGALSALKFSPGKLYSLIVSSAEASEVISIQIESPKQGASGPTGPTGIAGTSGATGPQGPSGAGRSIVVKDANHQTLAYLVTPEYPGFRSDQDPSSAALMMLASSGKIVDFDLATGEIAETVGVIIVYYTEQNCLGAPYFDYTHGAAFPVLNRLFRMQSDNRYYEVVGFAQTAQVQSRREYTTVGQMGVCKNGAATIGSTLNAKRRAVKLQSATTPDDLRNLAPIKLELE